MAQNASFHSPGLPALSRRLTLAPVWAQVVAVALGSLVIAASAQIEVPMLPVPMTMQTYAVLLVGALYGARLGGLTLLAYLTEGLLGLPVLAGGAGGVLHFMGPTGGYLVGFLVSALMVGFAMQLGWGRSLWKSALAFTAAHAVVFAFGVPWLAAQIGWDKAIAFGLTPFLIGSVVKTLLAMASYEAAVFVSSREK